MNSIAKIAKEIKLYSFKKEGNNWRFDTGDLIHFIGIQKSRFNTKEEEKFTINVGIFSKKVNMIIWNVENNKPKEEDCLFNERISYFMDKKNYGLDKWWIINHDTNLKDIENEIISIINPIVHFLNNIQNNLELLKFIENYNTRIIKNDFDTIQLSALLYINGYTNEAENLLSNISTNSTWYEKKKNLMKKINNEL